MTLTLNFSPIFGPRNSFFSFQAQPRFVSFWPKKSFSFFFFSFNCSIFFLSSAPAFFWPEKFFSFFENCSIFGHYTQILPNFRPRKSFFFLLELSPSLFFYPKSHFFLIVQFLARKILLLLLKLSPSLIFCPKMFFFFFSFLKIGPIFTPILKFFPNF